MFFSSMLLSMLSLNITSMNFSLREIKIKNIKRPYSNAASPVSQAWVFYTDEVNTARFKVR